MGKATHPSQLSGYACVDLGLARDPVPLALIYNSAVLLRIARQSSRHFGQDSADGGDFVLLRLPKLAELAAARDDLVGANERTGDGTARPSALPALKLMASSKLVGHLDRKIVGPRAWKKRARGRTEDYVARGLHATELLPPPTL